MKTILSILLVGGIPLGKIGPAAKDAIPDLRGARYGKPNPYLDGRLSDLADDAIRKIEGR